MKKFFYTLFALFFKINRISGIRQNRVVLLAPHRGGSHDSLGAFEAYLKEKGGYETVRISTPAFDKSLKSIVDILGFFFIKSRKLARAKYVFLNDNFMPMAQLNFSKETVITQLWHAEGAFKKFSLLLDLPGDIMQRELKAGKKLSFVTCTSENLRDTYAKAFGVNKEKVLPIGSPRLDYLFSEHNTEKIRADFDRQKPDFKGKKLILYAPTFRDEEKRDSELISHIDIEKFNRLFGEEYALLVKLHPQIHSGSVNPENDVTGFDIADLTLICDIVITDYSSVCMDFALLNKPCIFYAYDLEEYEAERSFCFGFEDYVPGSVVKTFDALLEEIKNPKGKNKDAFEKFNFDYKDNKNCERLFNAVMKGNR